MNQTTPKKPFFPKDKPKSWVVFISCILAGLLIAGPLLLSGIVFEIEALEFLGGILFWCCWIMAAAMWLVFILRSIAGHYREIEHRDWSEQIW